MEGKTSRPNPKVTAARRTARYTSSRSASRSFSIERPPIIIEIGSSVVRVGFAEQFKPQHIFPYVSNTKEKVTLSETQWYSALAPIIDEAYDRLMVSPTTRRVVCVHSHFPEKAWLSAVKQILWNRGVPALCFVSSLEMLPVAQGWKRGMIVQVGSEEAVCVAHVDGHILPYTYQSVTCGYKSVLDDDSKIQYNWNSLIDQLMLDEREPTSLVFAMIKCLEACPRDSLTYVVSNIVFCGEALIFLPDLARRVGKKLQLLLEGGTTEPFEATSVAGETKEEKEDETQLTSVPIRVDTLRPLADHLAVTSSAPYRPDLISWTGTSLWAAVWYKYDGDESRVNWTFVPTE